MPPSLVEESVAEDNAASIHPNGQAAKIALLRASLSEPEEGTRPYRSALALREPDSHSLTEVSAMIPQLSRYIYRFRVLQL